MLLIQNQFLIQQSNKLQNLEKQKPITKEEISLRNKKCDKYFEYKKPPENYKIK
jgi:hypothetical protein